MPNTKSTPSISQPAALLVALLAAVVLWFYREVTGVDVALRLMLPVLWLTVWSVACFGSGVWACRVILGRHADPPLVVVLATGAAGLALVATLMALAGIFRPWPLRIVLVAAAVEGIRRLARVRFRPTLPAVALGSAPGILLVAAGAVTVAVLTTPPVMFDVLNYHLAFPSRWLAAGGLLEFPRHFYGYYPAAQGTLYGFALAVVGPWGASAIHWWMGLVAVLGAATLGERLGGRRAATWAAAIFGLTPVVLEVAGYAIADLALAAWGGAALVVVTDRDESPGAVRRGLVAGTLVGTAAAAKYLALATVVVPVVLAALLLAVLSSERRRLAALVVLVVAAGVVVSPWLIRNAIWTGNPIYPYLQDALGGPPSERDLARELLANDPDAPPSPGSLLGAVTAPVVRTFHPLRSGGLIGPHWLFLLPAALLVPALRTRDAAPLWVATVAGLLAWGSLVHYARFLMPVLVPAAALAGGAAASLTGETATRTVDRLFALLLVAILGWNLTVLATGFQLDRLGEVLGVAAEEDYVNRWVSYGPAIRAVNEALPPDAVLLLVAEPRSLYLDRPVLVEDPNRTPLLVELARGAGDSATLAERVRKLGATHILINRSEMGFYAGMRSHADYWEDASAAERAVIDGFLTDRVRPILRTETLLLGEIEGTP